MIGSTLPYRPFSVPIRNLQTGEVVSVTVQSQTKADAAVDGFYRAFALLNWRKTGAAGEPVEVGEARG